jgi:hypothetical protein
MSTTSSHSHLLEFCRRLQFFECGFGQIEVDKSGRYRPAHGYNHRVHPRPHYQFDYEDYPGDVKPILAEHHKTKLHHHQSHRHHRPLPPQQSDTKPVLYPGYSLNGYDRVVPAHKRKMEITIFNR